LSKFNLLLHDQQHPPSSIYPQQQNPSLHLFLNSNAPPHQAATLHELSPTNNIQSPIVVTPPLVVPTTPPIVTPVAVPIPTTTIQTPVVTTAPTVTNRAHHNDMNDASNISKILQLSISNGSGSNSTISTNNNMTMVTSSSDKRPHDSMKYYQREDSMKESKTIGRSKKKEPKTPTKTEKPIVVNNQQHKHVNGSSESTKLTNNSNHHQNGDESYSEEDVKKWETSNQETRILVFREIRKFGRDYSGLFKELEKVKGNLELQHSFVQTCINECMRFKRKAMATSIEDWWEKKHVCKNGSSATGNIKLKI
jgi:integrator complex subunit 6